MNQTTIYEIEGINNHDNSNKVILDLCGGTGSWSNPYKKAGYDVRVITLPDYDILTYQPPDDVYGILAAPPCEMFSIARNDKAAKNPRDLRKGMINVNACLNIIHNCLYEKYKQGEGLRFWALENPATGYLKKFLGRPVLVFQPYEYGDPYTKQTALWGYFNNPKKKPVTPIKVEYTTPKGKVYRDFHSNAMSFAHIKRIPDGYCEKTGYSKFRVIRSMTPDNFAVAFYLANK